MRLRFLLPVLLIASGHQSAKAQATVIILARHAEKSAPSGDPGLTAAGEQRARDLAETLKHVQLDAIVTTQFQRTLLTAAPAGSPSGLEPIQVSAGRNTTTHAEAIARVLDSLPAGSTVLVVGHSNTIGPIIAALGGPRIPDLCDPEHSTLFILTRPGNGKPVSLVRSRYGAAESPEASRC